MPDTITAQALYGIRFLEALGSAPSNLGAGRYGLWVDSSGRLTFGNSDASINSSTLAGTYKGGITSTDSRLLLDSTRAGVWVKDNATPIGVILFAVTDSTETSFYLSVRATRTLVQNSAQDSATAQTAFRVAPGAHTNTTLSTEIIDIDFQLNRTVQFATGAVTTNRSAIFRAPTLAFVGASTVTNAATLAIDAAPVQGTNATITNAYALWVQAGMTRLGGALTVDGDTVANSITSKVVDGAAAVAHALDTSTAWSTTGAKLLSIRSNAVEYLGLIRSAAGFFNIVLPDTAGVFSANGATGIQVRNTDLRLVGGSTNSVRPNGTAKAMDVGAASAEFRNVFGAHVLNRTAVADADYVMVNGDGVIAYSSLSTGRGVTLLTAASVTGRMVWVVNETSNTSTITVSSASTIRGTATIGAAYGASGSVRAFLSTGSEWISIPLG
jgi:hypothetical protein